MNTLWIIRGLAGSGKTTLASTLMRGWGRRADENMFSADDYFVCPTTGAYEFDRDKLKDAHNHCLRRVHQAMVYGRKDIVVHNTFSTSWEAQPYFDACEMHGYTPFVIECQNMFGSTHDVPDAVVHRMHERWQRITPEPPLPEDVQQIVKIMAKGESA